MRRAGPRRIGPALEGVKRGVAPVGALAAVQSCWPEVAGAAVARSATPVAGGGGSITVACESATWAQELDLQSVELLRRLNEALVGAGHAPVGALRFRVGPRE